MCIVTITLPVQSQVNERSCVLLPLHYLYKARTMSDHVYCYHYTTCTKTGQWASCVLLPLHYLYKASTISCQVYCYHYTTCTKTGKWAVMCIVTITLPVQGQVKSVLCIVTITLSVQSQVNSRHVYCYHYTTCTKPVQWTVMCIVTIKLSVQSQVNERSSVLLPLHYLYKAR